MCLLCLPGEYCGVNGRTEGLVFTMTDVVNVTVSAQGMTLPIGFKEDVEDYAPRLGKTAPAASSLAVVLKGRENPSRGKDSSFKVTARLVGKGVDETVVSEGRTPVAALDKSMDVLARQLRQAKEKRVNSHATPISKIMDDLDVAD